MKTLDSVLYISKFNLYINALIVRSIETAWEGKRENSLGLGFLGGQIVTTRFFNYL